MTDREALRAAIAERPDDDTLRLVYADALEENGTAHDRLHAEFFRVSCHTCKRPGYKVPTAATKWLQQHWHELAARLVSEHRRMYHEEPGPVDGARVSNGRVTAWFRFATGYVPPFSWRRSRETLVWARLVLRFERGFVVDVTCPEWANQLVRVALANDGLLGPFTSWRYTAGNYRRRAAA